MQKDDEFNQIKIDLVNEIRGMRSDMNRLFETVQLHDYALYGDKKSIPGAMEELRIIKSADEARKQHQKWIWGAVVASFVERVSHYLFHWGK